MMTFTTRDRKDAVSCGRANRFGHTPFIVASGARGPSSTESRIVDQDVLVYVSADGQAMTPPDCCYDSMAYVRAEEAAQQKRKQHGS